MPSGGKRKGAGRPKGAKDKPVYVPEKGVLQPLDYMLEIMRNRSLLPAVRMEAATKAAPYCHARLQATDLTVDGTLNIYKVSQLADIPTDD